MDGRVALAATGYGLTVGLRCAAEHAAAVRAALPFWWAATEETPQRWWDVPDAGSAAVVVRELEHWVAEHSPGPVFVHAGAVLVDGWAVLLPGPSCSGKSTLVAALVAAGAGYLSDEYAVLDEHGRVHAYPRPPRLRPDVAAGSAAARAAGAAVVAAGSPVSGDVEPPAPGPIGREPGSPSADDRPAPSAGGRPAPVGGDRPASGAGDRPAPAGGDPPAPAGGHPVAVVADLAYRPGPAADWAPCAPSVAALRLFANAVAASRRPAAVTAAAAAAAGGAVAVRGHRGAAGPAAAALREFVSAAITRSDVNSVLV